MIPLVFGSAKRRLSGIFTPAVGRRQSRGVVLCPPLGQEMIRSHRTCRLLASRMSESGVDVLRFDYLGTGESAGDWRRLTLDGSIEDVRAAMLEIADLAGIDAVSLVGLRAGGLIAALSCEAGDGVDRLVLWDPVTDGREYADEYIGVGEPVGADGAIERQGFVFDLSFREALREVALLDVERLPNRLLYVASEDEPRHRATFAKLSNLTECPEFLAFPSEPVWTEMGNLGVGATPTDIIEAIAGW